MPGRLRLWDAPVRLFHWALAILVAFSWATGHLAGPWLAWHMRSGYAILALLAFRLAWGFVGSDSARFAAFLQGPRAAWRYLASLGRRTPDAFPGHNPAGGWMVVLMLAVLSAQAASGLFVDDEIATQGPLSAKASTAFVSWMNPLHEWNGWVVGAVVLVHVAAIAAYRAWLGMDLVGPMLDGRTDNPEAARLRFVPGWRAALLLAIAAGFVYWLVTVYPATP